MTERYSNRSGQPRNVATRMVVWAGIGVLVALVAMYSSARQGARAAGPLVVVEDASSMGAGSFSGSVCFTVTRDADGAVISENCVDAPASFAAPEGLETGIPYSIAVSLSDPNCVLLDDSRASDGSIPFMVRVSCDPAFMTATAAAQPTFTPTPVPTDTPTPVPTPTSTSSPEPSPTPSPTTEPTLEPTSTLVPTAAVSPTGSNESPTPESVAPTPSENEPEDAAPIDSPEITSPSVVDVQLSEPIGDSQHVHGTVTVSYNIPPASGATVSVFMTIENLQAGGLVVEPGEIVLIDGGELRSIGSASALGSCVAIDAAALPAALGGAVPIVTCTDVSEEGLQYQQVLVLEFRSVSGVSPGEYAGWITLTSAIAP